MRLASKPAIVVIVVGILIFLSVSRLTVLNNRIPALVPLPANIERQPGTFSISASTGILADKESAATALYLAQQLRTATGYAVPIHSQAEAIGTNGNILLTIQGVNNGLGYEGYELTATSRAVVIRGDSPGLFYGVQSLLQLLPAAVFGTKPTPTISWSLPCVHILDRPRFRWRGFMLDVSRHFFSKEEIKRVLDLMALHKLNTFHWHLTDDQGWRIEIKKHPRLVETGAWRKSIGFGLDPKSSRAYGPDGRYGGYYSQADVKEIVAYAQARHITIVPEIEMPGHSSAALAAYPEFACPASASGTQRSPDVYCAGNENSFNFVEDVLTEVCQLFPGKYIHIGGDEVSRRAWRACPLCQARITEEGLGRIDALQNYFVRRIAKFLESKERSVIGWSEINQGGLPTETTVMDWLGGAAEVARAGHDVVRCPNSYCYFDYYQARERASEPPASGAFLPLERVYSFEPIPEGLAAQYHIHVLGPQANLWTEYVPSLPQIEYMMFPRICAIAEVAWSPRTERHWGNFLNRLHTHCQRLSQLQVNYRKLN